MASESGATSLSSSVPLRLEFRLKTVTFKTNLPDPGVSNIPKLPFLVIYNYYGIWVGDKDGGDATSYNSQGIYTVKKT